MSSWMGYTMNLCCCLMGLSKLMVPIALYGVFKKNGLHRLIYFNAPSGVTLFK